MASQRVSPTKHSMYAPLRYEATRPFAVRLGTQYIARSKGTSQQRRHFLTEELAPAIHKALDRMGPQPGPGPAEAEITNVQVFSGFLDGGRIIYDFHKGLTVALMHTDVDSLPISAIPKISSSLYLHFGHQVVEALGFEGAFVSWKIFPGETPRLNVRFTTHSQFSNPFFWASEKGEPMMGVPIDVSDPSQGIAAAIQASSEAIVASNAVMLERIRQQEADIALRFGLPATSLNLGSTLMMDSAQLNKGVALAVNCLLFLSIAEHDVVERWDDRAPSDLVHQAEHADKPGARKTAERTLSNRDYLKVRLVGHKFAASVDYGDHHETGRTMVTHYRRGHFRNQPYGPERAMRKIVFIPPVVVNAGLGEPPGRIYEA